MHNCRMLKLLCVAISVLLLLPACSIQKNIPASFYKEYKTEVLEIRNVQNVQLSFRRPMLTIEVNVLATIIDDEIDKIVDTTKSFVTVEKMNDIADYVKWDPPIWDVELEIVDNKGSNLIRRYEADYFKTYNASDFSPENIDGYETWREDFSSLPIFVTEENSVISPSGEYVLSLYKYIPGRNDFFVVESAQDNNEVFRSLEYMDIYFLLWDENDDIWLCSYDFNEDISISVYYWERINGSWIENTYADENKESINIPAVYKRLLSQIFKS